MNYILAKLLINITYTTNKMINRTSSECETHINYVECLYILRNTNYKGKLYGRFLKQTKKKIYLNCMVFIMYFIQSQNKNKA